MESHVSQLTVLGFEQIHWAENALIQIFKSPLDKNKVSILIPDTDAFDPNKSRIIEMSYVRHLHLPKLGNFVCGDRPLI